MNPGIYDRVRPRITRVAIAGNLLGAGLTTFYTSSVGYGTSNARSTGITIAVMAALFGLSFFASRRYLAAFRAWQRTEHPDTDPLIGPDSIESMRRLALSVPAVIAGVSLATWGLAGLVFGVIAGLDAAGDEFSWPVMLQVFLGISALCGPVTATLLYFAVERVWRPSLAEMFLSVISVIHLHFE